MKSTRIFALLSIMMFITKLSFGGELKLNNGDICNGEIKRMDNGYIILCDSVKYRMVDVYSLSSNGRYYRRLGNHFVARVSEGKIEMYHIKWRYVWGHSGGPVAGLGSGTNLYYCKKGGPLNKLYSFPGRKELIKELKGNNNSFRLCKKSNRNLTLGTILAATGAISLFSALPLRDRNESAMFTIFGVGTVMLGISLPLYISSKKQLLTSIRIFNE